MAREHEGAIPLPLISNRKTVNPRDKGSRKVIQIETAMGAAIEVFEGATALQVPRSRFAPVKSNNDLLVVRSDAYTLSKSYALVVNPERSLPGLPIVTLDAHYYGLLNDFEARVKVVPSLVDAEYFAVLGDVTFSHSLRVSGKSKLSTATPGGCELPAEITSLDSEECTI